MFNILNIINFGNTFALLGLLSLPIIFLIIKYFPPTPKEKYFSSFYLLNEIVIKNSSKAKFPLWLLIYRVLLCFLIVLFFSKPYLTKDNNIENYENYIIFADNGWSISGNWQNYKSIIKEITSEAESKNKEIHLYFTSTINSNSPFIFKSSSEVVDFINQNLPLPMQISREKINTLLDENNYFKNSKVFFIFSRLDSKSDIEEKNTLNLILKNIPSAEIINPIKEIKYIEDLQIDHESIKLKIRKIGKPINNSFILQFYINDDEVLFEKNYTFSEDKDFYVVRETFPSTIINQFFKIKLANENNSASVFYLDDYRKKVNIGLVLENQSEIEKPLLSPAYYIKKSLDQNNNIYISSLNKILKQKVSIIFLPSYQKLSPEDRKNLKNWIGQGGVLINFSDNKTISQKDLYFDDKVTYKSLRNIGKELSLENKLYINNFKKNTLFHNLNIPNDLNFNKQLVLDNYNSDVIILASLNDQSPLITMKNVKKGKVILFHVTSNNEWSNLPMSSFFKDLLTKLLLIPKTKKEIYNEEMLIKFRINSFGELIKPNKNFFFNIINNNQKVLPSLKSPAGIYENNNLSAALNLAANLNTKGFFNIDDNLAKIKSSYKKSVVELNNIILSIIFIMFLFDMIINIVIKNKILLSNLFKKIKFILLIPGFYVLLNGVHELQAKEQYNDIFLAFIKTENKLLNDNALSGLNNLKLHLNERTSINPKGVKEIDIIRDEIFYFPLIYWQISGTLPDLNEKVIKKIKHYFSSGGIILFDIVDFSKSYTNINSEKLEYIRRVFSVLGIDNLQKIPKDHTLTKSYYLLKNFPGRWDNKILLLDNDGLDQKDGVNSVIVGLNDWSAAWAKDQNNYYLYQVVPGGDRQRELSIRFGINLVMYALTGNYKSDQVHSKSILERLKKKEK